MHRLLAGLPLLFVLAAAPDVGANSEDGSLQYFLHAEGECVGDGPKLFMDQEDTEADADGCGVVGPGVEGFDATFPGTAPLNATIAEGSKAVAHVFLATAQPDQFNVLATITAGRATCEGDSGAKNVVSTWATADYVDFAVACTFTGTAGADEMPTLSVTIRSKANYFFGYEGDHASYVDFEGLRPAVVENQTTETTPVPEEGSPGVSAVLVSLTLLAACAASRLRRA